MDTDGAAFSLTDDTDKDLTLVFFGYTNCPDICGQVMATLAGTLTRFDEEQKERVDVVFVTTDPARDDEAVTQDYVSAFDPSIIGLTGDLDDIVEVGKSLAVGVEQGGQAPQRRLRRHPRHPGLRHRRRRPGADHVGPRRLAGPAGPRRHDVARRRMMLPMLTVPSVIGSPLVTLMSIPSPADGVWNLGPVPIRGYALSIILGIVLAIWIGERRWVARGGIAGEVSDLAIWAVPFGLVGGRLYHVITDWQLYFGEGRNPITALYVWRGGLGVWGAIALGAFGLWLGARTKGIKMLPLIDALAPGVLVAQAVGRWGNWFNQELYGRPTDLPWGLEIDVAHRPSQYLDQATFHPAFLYECLWNLAAFALIIWLDRRFRLGHGRVAALYIMLYTLGRGWIENLRIDDVQMDDVHGAAAQRVDLHRAVRPRGGLVHLVGRAPPRPRGGRAHPRARGRARRGLGRGRVRDL